MKNKPTFFSAYSLEFSQIRKILDKYLPIQFNYRACADILKDGINVVSRRVHSLGMFCPLVFFLIQLVRCPLLGGISKEIINVALLADHVVSIS